VAKNKNGGGVPPRYLPDLVPCDFFLYPQMKLDFMDFKGKHFADVAEVQQESLVALESISVEDLRQCFQQWEQHWDHCIQSQGEYFKGD
jgi:hypothetical protein